MHQARPAGGVAQRPRFHVRPPSGWINDPNAPVRVGAVWHLFCQYNPNAAVHGDVHWAHFTSTDLLRWRLQPPALVPEPGGADADGCWSGSAVMVDGAPALLYSGYHADRTHQNVCLAWPQPDGSWRKDAANPVIAAAPDGIDVRVFRDPFGWRDPDGGYRCLMGAGLGSTGAALLYRSPDLRHWEYDGVLAAAVGPVFDGVDTGAAWECPQLARFGDDGLLLLAAWDPVHGPSHSSYVYGRIAGDRLLPRLAGRLDHGPDFYAAALCMDGDDRCLMWAWSREARPDAAATAAGWAGVLTLPRTLALAADGGLRVNPAVELAGLRGNERRWSGSPGATPMTLDAQAGDAVEIEAVLPAGEPAFLRVRASPDGSEYTEIGVDPARGEVYLDRELASLDPEVRKGRYGAPADTGGDVLVRIYVDRSIVEVFIDDRHTITARIYPTRADSTGLVVGGSAGVRIAWWPIGMTAVSPPGAILDG